MQCCLRDAALATIYGIVKQAGGHIRVNSEVGMGTAVEVLFPAFPDARAEAGPFGVPAPPPPPLPPPLRGAETVLLVEDEQAVRKLARIALAGQGYLSLARKVRAVLDAAR